MATQFAVDFTCPISLEIVSDLVILSSGHTFDRASIQRWLDAGHRTCPISKLPLPDHPSLIHNHALRSLISTYTLLSPAKLHHQYHHHRQQRHSHSQPQTPISTLTSPASTLESKLDSPLQVPFRAKLTESGAISAVLNWVDS